MNLLYSAPKPKVSATVILSSQFSTNMDLNRTRSLPPSSSSQKSSNFSRSPSNLSPLKDKEPPLSSPYQRSYADSHRTNVGFPIRQPGFMSDKNLPFSPPKFVEVESEDLSLFGSRAVNSDRFSGPPRALSRPELIYDADSHRTNVGFSFHQPGFTSDKNLPFTSPKLIEVESQDLSQFGSGAVNSEHHPGPPQESPHFSDNSNNLSPLKDKKPLLPLPSQRSDADLQWTNVSFPFHHPGLTSDMNLSFTSPKLIEPPLLCQSGNGKSTDLLQFGSRTVDSDHLPGPPQHHQLAFSPKTTRKGTESPADTMVIHPEIVPHNGSMSPLLDGNGVEEFNMYPLLDDPLLDGNGVEEFNMYPLLDGNGVDELNQGSLRKRQKASDNDEKDICCKCKKTECLKLFCACFASGLYCFGSCTCQDCRNTIANMFQVQNARKKVESHDPLAFAPNFTNMGTESSVNTTEDGTMSTPSTSRHKKGCNCKRAKCLSGYCVCFKGKLGCSFDCRCTDCQNSFGKRKR